MLDNKKAQANQIKTYLQERIKKIESGEIGGWELFKFYEKYVLNEGSDEVIFSWGPDLKETNYHFITTPESYETSNQRHIQVWGYGMEKEKYLLIDPQDYTEIVNLTKQRDQLRQTKITQWEKERDQKLANNPKLFCGWWMSGTWAPADKKQGLTFAEFCGQKEGRNYWLMLPKSHPSLVNLEKREGQFYLIEGLENIPIEPAPSRSTGENNPNNFNRWVELTDKITITPYEVENDNELPKKEQIKDCSICRKNEEEMDNGTEKWYTMRRYHGQKTEILQTCSNCYKNKEQEYLQNYESIFTFPKKDLTHEGIPFLIETIKGGKTDCYAGHKDQNGKILQQQNCSHCQPWKKHQDLSVSEMDIKSLIQYLQKYNVKKITFKNGELIITHNNNEIIEIISAEKINNKQELVSARNIIQKTNQQQLTKEDLEKMINSNSTSTKNPKSDNALWIGCFIGGVLIIGVVVGLVMSKKRNK